MMHVGVKAFAAATNPLVPDGGGGGTKGTTGGGSDVPGTSGVAGSTGGGGGTSPTGTGGAGGGGGGGGGDKLPFTGFPAAMLAGVGAGLAVGGKKLRSMVQRGDKPQH